MTTKPVIDGRYAISIKQQKQPGKPRLIALEKFSWREEEDGVRRQIPEVMALYSSPVLLVRDLVSDAIGHQVLRKGMETVSSYVAETRRLAELAEMAMAELQAVHD
ncbi:DUF5405 family protein [Mixta calida]|uniref:DUF5405 family protein n=1 Tax=Mixta calida TaxID=665913 RepID=UPI0029122E7C|nr:DUF5405 family protein [Mixta calida]MDU6416453.1 DUF5405 family protein [Mixta calida]